MSMIKENDNHDTCELCTVMSSQTIVKRPIRNHRTGDEQQIHLCTQCDSELLFIDYKQSVWRIVRASSEISTQP